LGSLLVREASQNVTLALGLHNGTMDHEWLFWDNQDFMKQIGLAP